MLIAIPGPRCDGRGDEVGRVKSGRKRLDADVLVEAASKEA